MSDRPLTAFITGGSSGIALALSEHLLAKGWHIFIADLDIGGAKALANRLPSQVHYQQTDVSSWESQLSAFQAAIKLFKRIDFVAPIAGVGERKWIPGMSELQSMAEGEFEKPNLKVLEVDLTGLLYTVALAVQQFRRQGKDAHGFRGKIGCVASICGLYCIPALPIYNASKHGVVGFVRSYGKLLPEQGIVLSAVCPNVVRTAISTLAFYDKVEKEGLLVEVKEVISAFDDILEGTESGIVYEVEPNRKWTKRDVGPEYLDEGSKRSCELIEDRARALHE